MSHVSKRKILNKKHSGLAGSGSEGLVKFLAEKNPKARDDQTRKVAEVTPKRTAGEKIKKNVAEGNHACKPFRGGG